VADIFVDTQPPTTASATIVVQPPPPTVKKTFGASTIPLNGTTNVGFTVTNPNAFAATGISFSDTLPVGLIVSTPNGLNTTCTGSINATAGTGVISLSGGALAANGSCMFSVNVTGIAPGVQSNTTGPISSNESGPTTTTSNTASLTVVGPPTLTKAFADSEIQLLGLNSTALSFTLTNPNAAPLTGLAFTDTLPSGLIVSTPNGLTGSCGGTITATAGSNIIGLSGGTLASGASCTFSVNVTGIAIGVQTNTTSTVTSNEAPPGAPATATTSVDDLFFFWFFAA